MRPQQVTLLVLMLIHWSASAQCLQVYYQDMINDSYEQFREKTSANGVSPLPTHLRTEEMYAALAKPIPFILSVNGSVATYQFDEDSAREEATPAGELMFTSPIEEDVAHLDIASQQLTFNLFSREKKSAVSYHGPLNSPDWTILSEAVEIMGFACQVATAEFCGSRVVVYYSTDIPLAVGPRGLSGLPGLILKAVYDGGRRVVTVSGVEAADCPNEAHDFTTWASDGGHSKWVAKASADESAFCHTN